MDVLLDTTFQLEFTDSIYISEGLDHYFFILNQFSGVSTELPASCINVVNGHILEIPVMTCLGDILEANTVYVLYISQRLNDTSIQTLSSVKGTSLSEAAFGLQYKSILFRTIQRTFHPPVSFLDIAADVVPEKCSPAFGSINVPLKPVITIAFSSVVHIGTGSIELRSATLHPSASVTVDVSDKSHVVLGEGLKSIQVYGVSLAGNERYQVLFDAGIVLSASGSKCGTTDAFVFTTELGRSDGMR